MKNRLIIIGAGGHGKVVADIAAKNGYKELMYADDTVRGECLGFPIICRVDEIEKYADESTEFVIAIGDNRIRKQISQTHKLLWASILHPSAQIGLNVKIREGTVIMPVAVINSSSIIGRHCIINSGTVIEHDNIIADCVHVSPNACLGGTVQGECTHIGLGVSVKNNISIADNSKIGASAVVVKDILRGWGHTLAYLPDSRYIKIRSCCYVVQQKEAIYA